MQALDTVRIRRWLPLLLALPLGFCWMPTSAVQAQPRASAELQPRGPLGLEELVVLRIRLEGTSNLRRNAPQFELDNFEVVGGPSQSTSLSIVNGATSSSVILSWHLRPLAVGSARVHGIQVELADETLRLQDLEAEIVEQEQAPRRRRGGSDPLSRFFSNDPFFDDSDRGTLNRRRRPPPRRQAEAPEVFLTAEVSPASPWRGQQAVYTLYLFTQVSVRSVNPEELPTFKGFWAETIPQPETLEPERVIHNGKEFSRVVLLQRALFPRRAGTLEIEPAVARLAASIPDNSLFGSLMQRAQEIVRRSNPVTVEVRELPEAPAGFQGAVGRLSLDANLTPNALEVGEAATLTLTLEGRGHLQGLEAPALPEMPGIQVFPPQQQSSERLRGQTITAERSWSFVLVPEKPGQWQLPAIEVPYFDPSRGRYEVASSEAFELTVRGTTQTIAQQDGRSVELHSIRTAVLPTVQRGEWLPWAPWLFLTPWALALLLVGWRNRSGGHTRLHGKRLLERLEATAHEDQPRRAAAAIEDAWRDYLVARFEIPQGCASTQWSQKLMEKGVPPATADGLVQLADDLHYLRYAPKLSSTDEIRAELIERSRKLAKALR